MSIVEPIYMFNGQDITIVICMLIRDVAHEISKKEKISFNEALDSFYESATYLNLQNTENVLWAEAAGYIADMYFAEKSKRLVTCA